MALQLLAPLPPTPIRVREEWTAIPGYSWLQLGKCWYRSAADDGSIDDGSMIGSIDGATEPPPAVAAPAEAEKRAPQPPWEMLRRTPGNSTVSDGSEAVDIIATVSQAGQPHKLVLVLVYRPPVDSWVRAITLPASPPQQKLRTLHQPGCISIL